MERGRAGGGEDMGESGVVERRPEVVKGVRSRNSGNTTWQLFLDTPNP